jgi:hypothetical protein
MQFRGVLIFGRLNADENVEVWRQTNYVFYTLRTKNLRPTPKGVQVLSGPWNGLEYHAFAPTYSNYKYCVWCRAEIETQARLPAAPLYPATSLPSRLLIRDATRYSYSKEPSLLLDPKNPILKNGGWVVRIWFGVEFV